MDENPVLAQADQTSNGQYTLTVASANGCTSVFTMTVSGILPPAATPTINAPDICAGEDFVLSTSADGVLYEWIGPNGDSPGTLAMPGLTTTVGTTTLDPNNANYLEGNWSVRVTDANGCVAISNPVNVRISPVPVVTASNTGEYCPGESVRLEASAGVLPLGGTDTLTFIWYDADPSVGGLTPLFFGPIYEPGVLPEGQTTFYVIANLNGCISAPASTVVTVYEQLVLTNVSGAGTYCENQDINLGALVRNAAGDLQAGATYTWTGPNGFSFSGTTGADGFAHAPLDARLTAPGTYTINALSVDGCPIAAASVIIDVTPAPDTPVLTVDDQSICEDEDFILSTTAFSGTGQVEYTWTFDDGSGPVVIATTNQPSLVIRNATVAQTGIYSVQVVVDFCPSFASNQELVTVFGALTVVNATNSTTATMPACEGDFVRLETPLIPGATYEWFGPGNFTSDLPSPLVGPMTVDNAGQYMVAVTLNGCAAVISDPTEVFVQPMPEVPTITNSGAVCEGGSITLSVSSNLSTDTINRSFEWYRASDNMLMGITSEPEFTLDNLLRDDSGEYYVVYTLGSCRTEASMPTTIQVDFVPGNSANAGLDTDYCAVLSINLDAEVPTIGTGHWTTLTGATISNPEVTNTEVIDLIEGENVFVWTLSNGACTNYDSDTVSITISNVPTDVADAGDDISLCGLENTTLSALRPVFAAGVWTQSSTQAGQGVTIVDPDSAFTRLEGLEVGNDYTFIWSLTDGVCADYARDTVTVSVFDSPTERAFIVDETLYS